MPHVAWRGPREWRMRPGSPAGFPGPDWAGETLGALLPDPLRVPLSLGTPPQNWQYFPCFLYSTKTTKESISKKLCNHVLSFFRTVVLKTKSASRQLRFPVVCGSLNLMYPLHPKCAVKLKNKHMINSKYFTYSIFIH